MHPQKISRREFLRLAGLHAALYAGGIKFPALAEPFTPDAEIAITAKEKYVPILTGIAFRSKPVHRNRERGMCLPGDGTETHGSGRKSFIDVFCRFNLINADG